MSELGIWRISNDGAEEAAPLAALAVNLADASETDLRAPVEQAAPAPGVVVAGWLTRPIWFYLVTAACLLTVSEWWLYQRRIIT